MELPLIDTFDDDLLVFRLRSADVLSLINKLNLNAVRICEGKSDALLPVWLFTVISTYL